MTDETPAPLDPDELASAVLDGAATSDDPEIDARVQRFAAIRAQMAVDAPPAGVLDGAVEAALAEFTGPTTTVGDLAAARERAATRRTWAQRVPLGAVAAAVVVVALAGAYVGIDRDGQDDLATADGAALEDADSVEGRSGASADGALDDFAESEALAPTGGGQGGTGSLGGADGTAGDDAADTGGAAPPAPVELRRSYADVDELVADFGDRFGDGQQPEADNAVSAVEDADGACDAPGAAAVESERVVVVEYVDVAGDDLRAVVYESTEGRRVAIVDAESCSVVDDRAL